ncbi:hypothetical protein, partial [Streptomyces sp. H39-S7]|uniref:hypothetical protein n=1 Tax=Streptomyces sp. H39-S7 TaxID=3004357 RepID=UPI0022AED4F4
GQKDFVSKEPPNETRSGSARGVLSLALTFGTLLSSQGTDASFGAILPAPSELPFVFLSLADPISRFCHPLRRAFVSRLAACPLR